MFYNTNNDSSDSLSAVSGQKSGTNQNYEVNKSKDYSPLRLRNYTQYKKSDSKSELMNLSKTPKASSSNLIKVTINTNTKTNTKDVSASGGTVIETAKASSSNLRDVIINTNIKDMSATDDRIIKTSNNDDDVKRNLSSLNLINKPKSTNNYSFLKETLNTNNINNSNNNSSSFVSNRKASNEENQNKKISFNIKQLILDNPINAKNYLKENNILNNIVSVLQPENSPLTPRANNNKITTINNLTNNNYNEKLESETKKEADPSDANSINKIYANKKFVPRMSEIKLNEALGEFNYEDYKIIAKIGEGSFGQIYHVEDKLKRSYCMKKIIRV